MQTEFQFTLPKGYLDQEGKIFQQGTMRLATAMDEIAPLRDPRVQSNPAYATVIILSRVITQLGSLEEISLLFRSLSFFCPRCSLFVDSLVSVPKPEEIYLNLSNFSAKPSKK